MSKNLSRRNFLKGLGGVFGAVFAKVAKLSLPELPAETIGAEQNDAGARAAKEVQKGVDDHWPSYFAQPRKPIRWICLHCSGVNMYDGSTAACGHCSYGHKNSWVCPHCSKATRGSYICCSHCGKDRYRFEDQTNSAWLGD